MKKLFLVSSFKDVVKLLTNLKEDFSGKTVTFIPTASKVEKVNFYVASAKKALQKIGVIVDELDICIATKEQIEYKLKNNDFIYVSGGNTFFLLQELKKSGADKIIIKEVNSGKLYIGESAGAMITSKNIEYAKDMDSIKKAPNLTDFDALNLVTFYTLPHYNNFPFKKIVQKILEEYSSKQNIIPISNSDAILVNDNKIDILNKNN